MLRIEHLKKAYASRPVLKDVSFEVDDGEIVALLGNNGAGKTTIISCILKMVKQDAGSIRFNGSDISKLSNRRYFTEVSALLETSINVYDELTGSQNIAYFAGLSNVSVSDIKQLMDRYLHRFDLSDHIGTSVGAYSRGMRQKLALILSLISSPQMILLDEPTLGLDVKSKYAVIDLLKEISAEDGISILLTTHQMDVVEKLGCRVVLLNDGAIEELGSLSAGRDAYTVTYVDDGVLVSEDVDSDFGAVYERYRDCEVVEIKKREIDLERYMLENLS